MKRLTKRLASGTAVLVDYSIHVQMESREKLCKLEEDMEAGRLVYVDELEKASKASENQNKEPKQAAGARSRKSAKKSQEQ